MIDGWKLLLLFVFNAMLLLCILSPSSSGLPVDETAPSTEETTEEDEDRRATWLETRNLERNFKELVYLSITELASEGLLNSDVVVKQPQEKRGRHQGFCFRKTKSGRFLPYICWKDGELE